MAKRGRKPMVVDLKKVEELAGHGLTVEQIAASIGMHVSTLFAKQAENEELADAIKRGREAGIATIANALFEKAKGGDLGAQIFYLKNRSPTTWKDGRGLELTGADGGPIASISSEPMSVEDWEKNYGATESDDDP